MKIYREIVLLEKLQVQHEQTPHQYYKVICREIVLSEELQVQHEQTIHQ